MKLVLVFAALAALAAADCALVYYETEECVGEAGSIHADGTCHSFKVVEEDNETTEGGVQLVQDEDGEYVVLLCIDLDCEECVVAEPIWSETCEVVEDFGVQVYLDDVEVGSVLPTCEP